MIQGVREYFRTRQNEDAIVLFGQNLEYDYEVTQSDGSKVWDKKIHEKDRGVYFQLFANNYWGIVLKFDQFSE